MISTGVKNDAFALCKIEPLNKIITNNGIINDFFNALNGHVNKLFQYYGLASLFFLKFQSNLAKLE